MVSKEFILSRLDEAVNGTEKEFFSDEELDRFATFYTDKWDYFTSEDIIAESFIDYWWNTDKQIRRCSECGELMIEGYCYNMGEAYYCGDECLRKNFTEAEWEEECEINTQSYYAEWHII